MVYFFNIPKVTFEKHVSFKFIKTKNTELSSKFYNIKFIY